MKKNTFKILTLALAGIALLIACSPMAAQAKVGAQAPAFTLTDSDGKTHKLADYQGKFVVLEWVNYDCPYVKKHYQSHNMQNLQKKYTEKDVVWLSINSSAKGKQGNFSNAEIKKRAEQYHTQYSAYLLDGDGKVGRQYGAKTTPHMYVIDKQGKLIYAGAIDSIKSTDEADIPKSQNYVANALDEALAGKPVTKSFTKEYGCSVKY